MRCQMMFGFSVHSEVSPLEQVRASYQIAPFFPLMLASIDRFSVFFNSRIGDTLFEDSGDGLSLSVTRFFVRRMLFAIRVLSFIRLQASGASLLFFLRFPSCPRLGRWAPPPSASFLLRSPVGLTCHPVLFFPGPRLLLAVLLSF